MQNEKLVKKVDIFLLPISIVTILVMQWESIFYLVTNDYKSRLYFSENIDKSFTFFGELAGNVFHADVATMILWGVIGLVVYSVVSLFSQEIEGAHKAKNFNKLFVVPKKAKIHAFPRFLLRNLVVLFFLLVMLCWLVVSITILLPYANVVSLTALTNSDGVLDSIWFLIISIATITLIYYVPLFFYRIISIVNTYFE